ncbi:MAG: cupin domain-containing protein [Alphaproteobacteria bacterium]|jgi:quercetin dioxygenase-like cupin family protein|nr:cupin domain-containing protein [Alphaproteobacteria bacterium]
MKENSVFPKGVKASSEIFTGNAYVNMLVADNNKQYNTTVYDVIFEKGARNNWHTHSQGQILLITAGKGFYQERGQKAKLLQVGDVVDIPANVEHWHGATEDSSFTHIGITPKVAENDTKWGDTVSEEEYFLAIKENK